MDIEYKVSVVLIPIFADRSSPQSSFDYYKILIDDDNQVLKKRIDAFHKDIDNCVNDLYNDLQCYIKLIYCLYNKKRGLFSPLFFTMIMLRLLLPKHG